MADNSQGDFAQPLAGQAQQQVVNVANTVSVAALKHVEKAGVQVDASTRSSLNLIEGDGVTLTVADNSDDDRVDVTVTATTAPGTKLDSAKITTDTSNITATTEATAVAVITGNSVTYDGTEVMVEFFAPYFTGAQPCLFTVVLLCDTTVIGHACGRLESSYQDAPAFNMEAFHTPSAGSHTYSAAVYVSADHVVVKADAGGSGKLLPAFLRVTKA